MNPEGAQPPASGAGSSETLPQAHAPSPSGAARESVRARRLEQLAGLLLVTLAVLAPLLFGSVHTVPRLLVFSLAATALGLVWAARLRRGRPAFLPIATWLPLLFCLGALLQIVPLPPALLQALSPAGAEVWRWAAGSDAFGARPISLDPSATRAELAKWLGYLACLLAACGYVRRTERARRLELAVVASACAIAVLGFLQASIDPNKILFFYEPQKSFGVWVRGTFINTNHFGALMALAAPVALARCLREKRRAAVSAWLAAVVVLDVATLLSLSRGAVLAGLAAHLVVLAWAIQRKQAAQRVLPRALGLAGGLLALAYLVVTSTPRFGPAMAVSEQIDLHPLSKLNAWRAALPAIADHPLVGIGRGAQATAFARYSEVAGKVTFPWLENSYLQVALDFGLPLALLFTAALVLTGYVALCGLRAYPDRIGALAGLCALGIHDLTDFSLEVPGVAVPALILAAVIFARRADERPPLPRLSLTLRVRPWFLGLAGLPIALSVAELGNANADTDLRALSSIATGPPAALRARARALLRRHPADYTLPLVVAEGLTRAGEPDALSWVNHAMYLNPRHARPHVLAALHLLAHGKRGQALLELGLAARGAANARDEVWPFVARHFHGDELLAIAPDDPALAIGLAQYLRYEQTRHAEAGALLLHAVAIAPDDPRALQEAIDFHLGANQAAEADALLVHLLALDDSERSLALAVRTTLKLGAHERAASYLARMPSGSPRAFASSVELARGLIAADALEAARSLLGPVHAWELTSKQRVELHDVMAALERKAGNEHRARWELERKAALGEGRAP